MITRQKMENKFFTKLSCLGYRGFAKEQILHLAIPNGKRGSGLTVLVGPNGGGKSTLVESLSKFKEPHVSFSVGKRNINAGDKVLLRLTNEKETYTIESVEAGSSTVSRNFLPEKMSIYNVPSRRTFQTYFPDNESNRRFYASNQQYGNLRNETSLQFYSRFFSIQKDSNIRSVFNQILKEVLGYELHWTIDQDDTGNFFLKINKHNKISHNSDGLGEGIVSLMFLVDSICQPEPNDVIVIDEPELSLHPQLQLRFLDKLLEVSCKNQVIISTHSPNMISLESAINGGNIARVYSDGESSIISEIDDDCRKFFKSSIHNLYNPHILGLDARACFFAEDEIVLTEGQEDVLLYPMILEQIGYNEQELSFFGFGAGGAENIEKVAHLMSCLGFKKVAAIYDGDKEGAMEAFNKNFSNVGYEAWCIPANDIRYKEQVKEKPEKDGLMKKVGGEYEIQKQYIVLVKEMFDEINTFMKEK